MRSRIETKKTSRTGGRFLGLERARSVKVERKYEAGAAMLVLEGTTQAGSSWQLPSLLTYLDGAQPITKSGPRDLIQLAATMKHVIDLLEGFKMNR